MGGRPREKIVLELTRRQAEAVLKALEDDWGTRPTRGSYRKALEKVRKALGVWEERSGP
jgi:hypothetical protein